jgi:hypothetical protein
VGAENPAEASHPTHPSERATDTHHAATTRTRDDPNRRHADTARRALTAAQPQPRTRAARADHLPLLPDRRHGTLPTKRDQPQQWPPLPGRTAGPRGASTRRPLLAGAPGPVRNRPADGALRLVADAAHVLHTCQDVDAIRANSSTRRIPRSPASPHPTTSPTHRTPHRISTGSCARLLPLPPLSLSLFHARSTPHLIASPCRRPASGPTASCLGCPARFSCRSRKGGPARSGGPPFLESPGLARNLGPEAGRRPVGLKDQHPETNAYRPTARSRHVNGLRRPESGGTRRPLGSRSPTPRGRSSMMRRRPSAATAEVFRMRRSCRERARA